MLTMRMNTIQMTDIWEWESNVRKRREKGEKKVEMPKICTLAYEYNDDCIHDVVDPWSLLGENITVPDSCWFFSPKEHRMNSECNVKRPGFGVFQHFQHLMILNITYSNWTFPRSLIKDFVGTLRKSSSCESVRISGNHVHFLCEVTVNRIYCGFSC